MNNTNELNVTVWDEAHHVVPGVVYTDADIFAQAEHPVVMSAVSNSPEENMAEAIEKARAELAEFKALADSGKEFNEDELRRLKELGDRSLYLTAAAARDLKDTPMGRYVERKRKAKVKERARKDRAIAAKPTKADRKAEKKRRKQKQRSAKK